MPSPERKVWLAIPHVGSISPWVLDAVLEARAASGSGVYVNHFGFSIATHTFNYLWCEALNHREALGLTHFAMIHADIHPEAGWLDTMIDEMGRTGADVLSAVVAIKDCKGLTSTGLREREWPHKTRRLTMKEIMGLPETFEACPGKVLGINTGLWVCRLYGDWPAQFPGFRIENRIAWEDGKLRPYVDSEDWLASDWFDGRGLKVMATRKVKVWHTGLFQYPNDVAWGEWETDREYGGLA